jgi:hypothetical protein
VVRHPLHIGNYLIFLGLALVPEAWWLALLVTVAFVILSSHLMFSEEARLERRFGAEYSQWAERVPAFLPNPFLWEPPACRFSFGELVRREQHNFYRLIAGFIAIEFACDLLGEHESLRAWISEDVHWVLLLASASLLYISLLALQYRADRLAISGALAAGKLAPHEVASERRVLMRRYTGRKAAQYELKRQGAMWNAETAEFVSLYEAIAPATVLDCPIGTGRWLDLRCKRRRSGRA